MLPLSPILLGYLLACVYAGIRIGDAVQGEMNKVPSIPNVSKHPANRLTTDTGKSDDHLPLQ